MLHELVVSIPFWNFKLLAFGGMIAQVQHRVFVSTCIYVFLLVCGQEWKRDEENMYPCGGCISVIVPVSVPVLVPVPSFSCVRNSPEATMRA